MQYFLSFDVGTTSMKCLLFDETFQEVFFDEREYTLLTPSEGIVELDPCIYYTTLCLLRKEKKEKYPKIFAFFHIVIYNIVELLLYLLLKSGFFRKNF